MALNKEELYKQLLFDGDDVITFTKKVNEDLSTAVVFPPAEESPEVKNTNRKIYRILSGEVDKYGFYNDRNTNKWYKCFVNKKTIDGEQYDIVKLVNVTEEKAMMRSYEIDPLTKLHNRGKTFEETIEYISSAVKKKEPFGFLIFDVDNFKGINDTYGHPCGDMALESISKTVGDSIRHANKRPKDIIGRIGGDEFLIVFRNITKEDLTNKLGVIQELVNESSFDYEGQYIDNFTISCGVRYVSKEEVEEFRRLNLPSSDISKVLFKEADDALYKAKESGKAKFMFSDDEPAKTLVKVRSQRLNDIKKIDE